MFNYIQFVLEKIVTNIISIIYLKCINARFILIVTLFFYVDIQITTMHQT